MGPKPVAVSKPTPGAKPSRGSVGPATKPKAATASSTPAAGPASSEPPKADDEINKNDSTVEQQQSDGAFPPVAEDTSQPTAVATEDSKDEGADNVEVGRSSGVSKEVDQEVRSIEGVQPTPTAADVAIPGGAPQESIVSRDERSVSPAASEPAILSVPPLAVPSSNSTSAAGFPQPRAPSRELIPTDEAVQIASMTVALGVEGLLHPLNSALRETAESQRAMRDYLAEASRRQRRINETLATVEPTFAKLPRYIEKLALMKKNLDTLEYNVKKIRKNACDVKSEVDEVLAPKLHPVQKK